MWKAIFSIPTTNITEPSAYQSQCRQKEHESVVLYMTVQKLYLIGYV